MDNFLSFLVIFFFAVFMVGLWLYCFLDVLNSRYRGNEKLLWVVVVVLAPVLGVLLYLFIGTKNKIPKREFRPFDRIQ